MQSMKSGLAEPAIKRIANAFEQLVPSFDTKAFQSACLKDIEQLELKQRVIHIAHTLAGFLPKEFSACATILAQVPSVWDHGEPDDPLSTFAAWPVTDFVAEFGMQQPDVSLDLLAKLTPLFSAEFAIRPFIIQYPELTHQYLTKWLSSSDEHVRRLVSEGTRPRLPWGMQLQNYIQDPSDNLPLLKHLACDESLYVRRSVANHLNDIAKDHPDIVINTCQDWLTSYTKKAEQAHLTWLIKHATRTLVKAGHPEVFPLLGYEQNPNITASTLTIEQNSIELGESINFAIKLRSGAQHAQKLVVDYAIYFVKANGEQKPKVFKLKNILLPAQGEINLEKVHTIKAITTRKYYPGTHKVALMINGKEITSQCFELQM
ncbi:DNA alkylation repair protein [Catenovulum sp. SM1970]|uniref:DNA alkylation repair protein n=1 Tax=Marinifaba aquimaris TaxID=2741323 RepID=UPI001572E5A0|nr:DNA alkylation repair protein [Marinifaba aquimaris]NTS78586.1 DNA alkylation repair protein [Marinifaba aquimaris]